VFIKSKWKSILTLIVTMAVMVAAGYIYGFYNGPPAEGQEDIDKRTDISKLALAEKENDEEEETVAPVISPETDIIFNRFYTLCKDVVVEKRKPFKEEIGSDISGIRARFNDWDVEEFSEIQVVLKKEIDNYCSNHYIVQEQGGLVTIYIPVEEKEGLEVLNQTSIKVSSLHPALQEEIEEGLVVDSLEQVEILMESWES